MITLKYLAINQFELAVGDMFNVHQTTVSKVIQNVTNAIADRANEFIHFPVGPDETNMKRRFFEKYNLPFVVGSVDGTHVRIMVSGGGGGENGIGIKKCFLATQC